MNKSPCELCQTQRPYGVYEGHATCRVCLRHICKEHEVVVLKAGRMGPCGIYCTECIEPRPATADDAPDPDAAVHKRAYDPVAAPSEPKRAKKQMIAEEDESDSDEDDGEDEDEQESAPNRDLLEADHRLTRPDKLWAVTTVIREIGARPVFDTSVAPTYAQAKEELERLQREEILARLAKVDRCPLENVEGLKAQALDLVLPVSESVANTNSTFVPAPGSEPAPVSFLHAPTAVKSRLEQCDSTTLQQIYDVMWMNTFENSPREVYIHTVSVLPRTE